MITQEDFDKYCRPNEEYIRVNNSLEHHEQGGDVCFVLDSQGYAWLYHCGNGLFFGVPIRSIGNLGRLYTSLTNKPLLPVI